MTRPVNIYNLSRIHEEDPFNIVERHHSQCKELLRTQYHEIESLRLLTDELLKMMSLLRTWMAFLFFPDSADWQRI